MTLLRGNSELDDYKFKKNPTLQKQVKYPESIHTNDHNIEIQTQCS